MNVSDAFGLTTIDECRMRFDDVLACADCPERHAYPESFQELLLCSLERLLADRRTGRQVSTLDILHWCPAGIVADEAEDV